jgi:hypothetical protein
LGSTEWGFAGRGHGELPRQSAKLRRALQAEGRFNGTRSVCRGRL